MKPSNNTVRDWLIQNNYEDIAAMIDKVMAGWEKKGTHTRRNWWEVLAGDSKGNPRKIEGFTFPVLRTARLRQKLDVTDGCICRNENEVVPKVTRKGRWKKRK